MGRRVAHQLQRIFGPGHRSSVTRRQNSWLAAPAVALIETTTSC